MKYLFMAAAATLLLTGCYTRPDHAGSPDKGTYSEVGPNDRTVESKAGDNLRDVGRQTSPTGPLGGAGNGSINY